MRAARTALEVVSQFAPDPRSIGRRALAVRSNPGSAGARSASDPGRHASETPPSATRVAETGDTATGTATTRGGRVESRRRNAPEAPSAAPLLRSFSRPLPLLHVPSHSVDARSTSLRERSRRHGVSKSFPRHPLGRPRRVFPLEVGASEDDYDVFILSLDSSHCTSPLAPRRAVLRPLEPRR